ncbi:MAG: outer membrane protein assembly factor BamB family protein [Planctomycetota bacterium]|jgi:outer membrane protein assembly factor BamB
MNWRIALANSIIISLCLASVGWATEVDYALEDVGGGQWVYHYTLTNDTLGVDIGGFVIWFEPGLYENLSIVSEPEIGYGWYQDIVWFLGAYRAFAWGGGIGVGENESGFAVRFTYLGEGAPGGQEFDIVDPIEYVSLEAGWTAGVFWVDAAAAGNGEQIGTPNKPFATIQQAIDAATDGYTINVLPGFYEESIDFLGKAITVKSYGATMDNPAIISGTGTNANAVSFVNGETAEAILDGFLITSSIGMRGIICANSSSPTIRNNLIFGCGYVGNLKGAAIITGSESYPIIIHNTITGNYSGYNGAVYIDSSVSFSGLISHCIIYHNERYDLCLGGIPFPTGKIKYCDIGKVDDFPWGEGWLDENEVDEYGNFNKPPRFVRQGDDGGDGWFDNQDTPWVDEGANNIQGDYHLRNGSPCINAGDPNYVPWEGQTDFDGQGRIILGRVDIGVDEVAPNTKVTRPCSGEVWAAGSSHEIEWESFVIDDVDIYYSSNNGADWEMIEAGVSNTGSYDWVLPAVDSDECLVWVAASEEPAEVDYTVSDVFTIRTSEQGPVIESAWPTLGQNSARAGLSGRAGEEVGCVKWQFATDGALYTSASIGAEGRVHAASEDGKLYTINPNDGTQVWVFDANSPMTSSPTVGRDGSIYVGCMNGRLYAIDKDGEVRWTHDTDAFIYSTPAVADDGKVFFGSQDGKLYALGADGSGLWEFAIAGPGVVGGAILAPAVIGRDGTVYVGGAYDPKLYALDPNDGSIRWEHSYESEISDSDPCTWGEGGGGSNDYDIGAGLPLASPVVGADGTLYMIMGDDLKLYAIDDANEGGILWSIDPIDHMQHAMDEHLQGWWEFEGATWEGEWDGDDVNDISGNERHGVRGWKEEGGKGSVLLLQGGYMEIPGYKGVTGTDPRTITAWIRSPQNNGCLVSWGFNGSYEEGMYGEVWKISTSYYGIQVHVPAGTVSTYYYDILDNYWHHIAVVWENDGTPDVADVKFYLDGVQTNTSTYDSNPRPVNTGDVADVWIGGSPSTHGPTGYYGWIDDFRIYDRALTVAEIYGQDADAYCWQRPAIGPDGTIYVSFDDTYLRAIDTDGNIKWAVKLGQVGGFTFSVGSDGLIYAASDDGSLYVVNSEGRQVARFEGGDWLSHPVIAQDGTIYLCDVDNKVWAISRDGCEVETADLHWAGDFNSDGTVDVDDVVILALDWMQFGTSNMYRAGDADLDMYVDLADFAAVVAKWLDEI